VQPASHDKSNVKPGRIITVFGSGLPRVGDRHYAEARRLGSNLARQGFVVCTGGYGGVMEAVSRGAKEAGGRTIGVTAAEFKSHANKWVDEEIRLRRWRERLFELVERGEGYIVCRGGTGTLVELAVVWEMMNKGIIKAKPVVVIGGFWGPIIERVKKAEGSRNGKSRARTNAPQPYLATSSEKAAEYMANYFRSARAKHI
jgi:uncharacterized protein (TIGR00725 family)